MLFEFDFDFNLNANFLTHLCLDEMFDFYNEKSRSENEILK